jgi:hypothetical protein
VSRAPKAATTDHAVPGRAVPAPASGASLRLSKPSDPLEREADRMADRVMRMTAGTVMRACSCNDDEVNRTTRGGSGSGTGTGAVGREVSGRVARSQVAPRGAGRPLGPGVRSWADAAFGTDLSAVRVHTGPASADAAASIGARAYAIGSDIVFGRDQFRPDSDTGRRLLAHELTHVVQAGFMPRAASLERTSTGETISRQAIGGGAGAAHRSSEHRDISMFFDGRALAVEADGTQIFSFDAQSGRPILVSEEDAEACGADGRLDTYMNDRRFVGIRDKGPIPEGRYRLRPAGLERIDPGLFGSGSQTTSGRRIHPGDWGRGRVALLPIGQVRNGPCGNAGARGGFFLHGGILAGSSGCIDIGSGFDEVADLLEGHRRNVVVRVEYQHPPPTVRFFTGLSGALAYQAFQLRQRTSLGLGLESGAFGTRAASSLSHEIAAAFAGGSLSVEPHLDIPFDSRETFVRAGLAVGTNFRLLHALYGRLRIGANVALTSDPTAAGEVGAGLRYEFGRVELEAMYDFLKPFSAEEPVHRVMVGVGFRFGGE